VHCSPSAFVHDAVAVLPTLTQVTEAEAIDIIDVMSRKSASNFANIFLVKDGVEVFRIDGNSNEKWDIRD
jgi:hypothetical protein